MKIQETNPIRNNQKEIEYPILMEWIGSSDDENKLVVYFIDQRKGIAMIDPNTDRVGKLDPYWVSAEDRKKWKVYEGTIALEND